MALNKGTIKNEVEAAFKQVMNDTSNDRTGTLSQVADSLAQAIVNAIQSAEIVYNGGLTAPSGAVTGAFNGELK